MKIRKQGWLFLVLPISQLMIIGGSYQALGTFSKVGYAGIFLGLVTDFMLFFLVIHSSQKEALEKELEEVQYLRETEKIHNEAEKERQERLLHIRDEFSRQLKEIAEKLESGERNGAEQEIQELQERLDATKEGCYCQNPIINAVLSEKQMQCQKLGVRMEVNLMIPKKLQVEPIHLCSVFSNLLDNALEAEEKLEKEERLLEVSAESKGTYLFIKVKNPAPKEHVFRDRRQGHGYGTQILESIAKQYDGEYRSSYGKDGFYTAVVVLKGLC